MRKSVKLILTFLSAVWLAHGPVAAQEKIIKSHGISTFGDLKYGADFKHFDYVNPDAPKGGEFSTSAPGTFDSMSPYILKGQPAALSSVFFETLMTGSSDEPDSMYGLLAETIEYPQNRQWIVFNMRSEARFSDGTPVTAQDVVFSFNILYEKGRPVFKSLLRDVETVEAIDDLTVKFSFKEGANTRELPSLVAGLPIFSKAYYATRDFAQSTLEPPVGSGQYLLDKVTPGKTVSYIRRDDYWGKDLPVNIGHNNFDHLTIEYYSDTTAAFEGFKGGVYNFRAENYSKLWATAYNFPSLEKGWVVKTTLPDGNPSGTQGYWINTRKEKFQDMRVREAIGLMFNFEWSNKTLFYGQYSRTTSFWGNSPMQATGLPIGAELALLEPLKADLPVSVFTDEVFTPNTSKAKQLDRSALRKAGKLLDAAGWKIVNGKRTNAKGAVLTIDFLNDSPAFERITNPYIANLIRLGIDAKLETVDPAQATERQKSFDYDIVIQRFVMQKTPGLELRSMFNSTSATTDGSNNLSGLDNPAIDALIEKVEQATSREELNTAVRALDRSLRALHIWIPQWFNSAYRLAYLDVYEHPENMPPYALGQMDFWWYNADKAKKLQAEGAFR